MDEQRFAACLAGADQGDAVAQYLVGRAYSDGDGVEKDEEKAQAYLQRAAYQKYSLALAELAHRAKEGIGQPKDNDRWIYWIRESAEAGNVSSQWKAGFAYYTGDGAPKLLGEAFKYFHMAAEQGNASAQSMIGRMYLEGESVDEDYAESLKWFRKAAEGGDWQAYMALGTAYAEGRGVDRDDEVARKWYEDCLKLDDSWSIPPAAKRNMKRAIRHLTKKIRQRAEGPALFVTDEKGKRWYDWQVNIDVIGTPIALCLGAAVAAIGVWLGKDWVVVVGVLLSLAAIYYLFEVLPKFTRLRRERQYRKLDRAEAERQRARPIDVSSQQPHGAGSDNVPF